MCLYVQVPMYRKRLDKSIQNEPNKILRSKTSFGSVCIAILYDCYYIGIYVSHLLLSFLYLEHAQLNQ